MTHPELTVRQWQVQGQDAFADTAGPSWPPAGPCVVMLHGALHDRSVWARQAAWLAEDGIAAMAPDLPGHGQSTGKALANVHACSDWLLALLAEAGVRRAALAGHSMGALVALEAAARATRKAGSVRVEAVVLLGVAAPMRVAPAMLDAARDQPLDAIDKMAAYSHAREAVQAREADRLLMLREQNRYADAGLGNLLLNDLAMCDAYTGAIGAASAIDCPATLVVGGNDRMTPAAATAGLAAALKTMARVELATGHNLMAEDPAGVRLAFQQACVHLKAPGQ